MEEHVKFTATLSTIGGDMGLRDMTDGELIDLIEEETNIPADTIISVEVVR